MSYNNNDWGPYIDIDGNRILKEEEETATYKQILDSIHSRRVQALNSGDRNSEIIHKNS